MTRKLVVLASGFVTGLTIGLAALNAQGETLAGYDRFAVKAAHRASPIAASIWYPVGTPTYRAQIGENALFKGTRAYVGAALAEGPHPLILLSHGSGGNMDGLSWLSSELALRGAMVLAVNHPGSTTGDSSPRRSVRLGERAADLSAALDQLLANPAFRPFVDRSRISSLGFSLGGATALNLAGLRFDRGAYGDYCAANEGQSEDCIFLQKGGVDIGDLPESFAADGRDSRVTSAVAIDPGMSYAVDEETIKKTMLQILFINLGEDTLWAAADVSPAGSDLARRLSNGTRVVVAPGHHFTFLAECKPQGAAALAAAEDDPICNDPEGTKRATAHAQIVEHIARFLDLASGL